MQVFHTTDPEQSVGGGRVFGLQGRGLDGKMHMAGRQLERCKLGELLRLGILCAKADEDGEAIGGFALENPFSKVEPSKASERGMLGNGSDFSTVQLVDRLQCRILVSPTSVSGSVPREDLPGASPSTRSRR